MSHRVFTMVLEPVSNFDNLLEELTNDIIKKEVVLFTGAGLTQKSGGISWFGLIQFLIEKFHYSSLLLKNWENDSKKYQLIIDDIFKRNDQKEIYESIQELLKDAFIEEDMINLMKFPWFTVFTTNYDSATENGLKKEQKKRRVIPVFRGDEYFLPGKNRELCVVYLMGSREVSFNSPGSMIFTTGQRSREDKYRSKIYDQLGSHAANLSFLFIGYSFDDDIFLETIKRVREQTGKRTKKFYAVFKNEPDEEKRYLLEGEGIEIVVCDLTKFTEILYHKYELLDPENYSKIRLLIGSKPIQIDPSRISDFLDNFKPVDINLLLDPVTAPQFFKGKTESFYPFKEGWHFKRQESEELKKSILQSTKESPCNIICVTGHLGTGRTFIIKSAIYDLITQYNSIAIQIQKYAINPFPDIHQILDFFHEVTKQATEQKSPKPERLIFWAEHTPEQNVILKFKNIAELLPFPIHFIFEEVANEKYIEDLAEKFNLFRIELSDNITKGIETDLIKYISETSTLHKFPEKSDELISRIVGQERQFLPIMYRTIDPTKESIDEIIKKDFFTIQTNEQLRDLIIYCSIASCVDQEVPITILVKVARQKFDDPDISYKDIYELCDKKGYHFINIIPDSETGYLFSLYHPIIAQKIVDLVNRKNIDQYLYEIVDSCDISLYTDARFIGNLLITNGVKIVNKAGHYYKIASTTDGLLNAFQKLYNRQPARPIIHHYARLIHLLFPYNENVIEILEKALPEPEEKYQMDEPKEYIYNSLAKIRWELYKDILVKKMRNDPEICEIFSLIEAAKQQSETIHPYSLHGRILMDLFENESNLEERMKLLTEALDVYDVAESILKSDDFRGYIKLQELGERLFNATNSIDPHLSLQIADDFAFNGDGTGFYYLSQISYKAGKIPDALQFIKKAMDCDHFPDSTIILKMKILIEFDDPPYKTELLGLADMNISEKNETWESCLFKGAIYTINSAPTGAQRFLRLAWRKAPNDKRTKIMVQIKEKGKPKLFTGKILHGITDKEGYIYNHNIDGLPSEIFFDPRSERNEKGLRSGFTVNFTIGFNSLGIVAVDLKTIN